MIESEKLLKEFAASIESTVESDMKSLTLEKAIEHCDNAAKRYDMMNMPSCAAEERQFAYWLRELQEYRKHGDALINRYEQEVEVMFRLQERLANLLREYSDKATAIGEEAKRMLIREKAEHKEIMLEAEYDPESIQAMEDDFNKMMDMIDEGCSLHDRDFQKLFRKYYSGFEPIDLDTYIDHRVFLWAAGYILACEQLGIIGVIRGRG